MTHILDKTKTDLIELRMSEKQLQMIYIATEEYFRLRMGQFLDLARDLCAANAHKAGTDFFVCGDPENAARYFKEGYETAVPKDFIETDDMKAAQDIWEYIKVFRGECKNPLYKCDLPLPWIRREGEKICMTIPESELRLICYALEQYMRIRYGQMFDLADDLAFINYDYSESKDTSGHMDRFGERIKARNTAQGIFETAYRMATGGGVREKSAECVIMQDMWDVIEVWHGTSRWPTPLICSAEPVLEITKL